MKKTFVFLPLAALALGGALPQSAAAKFRETMAPATPLSTFAYSVRVAADGPVPIQNTIATPGKPIPLTIKAPASGAKDIRFVMVRGLPESVTFTAGFRVRQSWFIAAKDLARVELVTPAQLDAGFILELTFFRASEEPPVGSTLLNVKIAAARAPDTMQESRAGQTLTAAPPSTFDDLDFVPKPRKGPVVFTPAQEAEMLKKGDGYMRLGDVASARLLFEDLAAHGSAKGALAMGKSYDPNVLKQIFVAGILDPTIEKARLWYQRAQDLGDADAEKRLTALER